MHLCMNSDKESRAPHNALDNNDQLWIKAVQLIEFESH